MKTAIHPFSRRQQMEVGIPYEIHHYRDSYLSEVAMHHHDFYEIYFFLSGKVSYRVENRTYPLQPGDILLISPLELHQPIIAKEKHSYERIVLWVSKSCIDRLSRPECVLDRCFDIYEPDYTNLLRVDAVTRQRISNIMELLHQETYGEEFGSEAASEAALTLLLIELNRQVLYSRSRGRRYEALDPSEAVISKVLSYINENAGDDISLDDLAEQFYISKYHLSREFKRLVGTSPYRYIIQKRLIMAKQLLLAGANPTDAYCHCGFGDYSNFYRAFKAEYGIGPKEFAKEIQKE